MVSHHSGSGSERKAVSTSTLRPPGKREEKLLEVNLVCLHLISLVSGAQKVHHVGCENNKQENKQTKRNRVYVIKKKRKETRKEDEKEVDHSVGLWYKESEEEKHAQRRHNSQK